MAHATEETIGAPFAGETATYFGRQTTFLRRDGRFLALTDGPDGVHGAFEVTHTFGVFPLRQYLVPFAGGRLQPLPWAWDMRPVNDGGQRWYHLYPDVDVTHRDPLHWTGHIQNWNRQCAACHSTDPRKGHDAATNTYRTTAAAINVACEACHGPGERHVTWAREHGATATGPERSSLGTTSDRGLAVTFASPFPGGHWSMSPATGMSRWEGPPRPAALTEVCAACHARRREIAASPGPRLPFLDHYVPDVLLPGLYHANGIIDGEVFEWGSFVQSRMHRAGVVCTDCHQPHGNALRAPKEQVCLQCHAADRFQSVNHHHHQPDGAGSQCVACHMPARVYMGIHVRHDHGFRVPRPDQSVAFGTPNACTDCHRDRDARWAATQVSSWPGWANRKDEQWVEAIAAGRAGARDAPRRLAALIGDPNTPGIARATALSLMRTGHGLTVAVRNASRDADPLVRISAGEAAVRIPPLDRVGPLTLLLEDPLRAVRLSAVTGLAGVPDTALPPATRDAFRRVLSEYEAAARLNDDQPEALVNLGDIYLRQGRLGVAMEEFVAATRLDRQHVQAVIGMAEALRRGGREAEAEQRLRQALAAQPDVALLRHALGLSLARQRRGEEAIRELATAVRLDPREPRLAYVHAVALNSLGRPGEAYAELRAALTLHPANRDILMLLALITRDLGARDAALGFVRQALTLDPEDAEARRLVDSLRAR